MNDGAVALWGRIVASTAIAAATFVLVHPQRPEARLPSPVAVAAGVGVGVVLFVAVLRRRPPSVRAAPTQLVALPILGVLALGEEIIWRRLVVGEALRAGPLTAVAVSALAFALVHRVRRGTHLVTGLAFAGTYVGTGSLAASVAAHWTYNALVAAALPRAGAPAVEAPA